MVKKNNTTDVPRELPPKGDSLKTATLKMEEWDDIGYAIKAYYTYNKAVTLLNKINEEHKKHDKT